METKLCRICGKLSQNYVDIFRTEGLKHRIETCLPIIVTPHSLLPDTICGDCSDSISSFYAFIKNCLQNIIILEAQYDITESCLKSKRRYDKSCCTDSLSDKQEKNTQTINYLDLLLKESEEFHYDFPKPNLIKLVDYDIESDTNSEPEEPVRAASLLDSLITTKNNFGRKYFDDAENYLISEITQRKNRKRKNSQVIESSLPKICKIDRRKNKQPKKFELKAPAVEVPNFSFAGLEGESGTNQRTPLLTKDIGTLPQVCLLCDDQFSGPSMLASHVFETHGIDMAHIAALADDAANDKKKKLPNLLKISDLRKNDSLDDNQPQNEQQISEEPPTLLPSFVCPLCPAMFTARPDLFTHLRIKHAEQSSLLCGMCLYQASTLVNLQSHVELCVQQHQAVTKYICQICRYGDDNSKSLENHILVHDFLLDACKKQSKMFDPADYIEMNDNYESGGSSPTSKSLSCSECGLDDFESFKDFSTHRRSQHSIFHCDLCNKFYGRNSHLWKHVNRLHKGHPSITCQLCYKTSASKYHLAQHFNKIHSTKTTCKPKTEPLSLLENSSEDFMSQKFQGFDFQSVKQSFMRQEMLEQEKKPSSEIDDNSNNRLSDQEYVKQEPLCAPKEIDSSSDLYTNIITNYTPPANEGEFKCPKCTKGFHKKTLLKKHKKNCRPRLQKDLLTRCKSCARIFKDRQSLAKHLVNYHSEYACEMCGQKVQSKCEIVSHIRFQHPGCRLFCTICGNILRSEKDMADHVRDHMDSYVCQFCADALPSKIKLKMHILSLHRKILSLSCGVCLKLFETQHVLREHVRLVHKNELAPLTSCPVCGKNYGSKWKTYDHLNKSHGRIFKACKACLQVFDNEVQLQAHYNTAHTNATVIKSEIKNNTQLQPPPMQVQNNCKSESERDSNSDQSYGEQDKDDLEEESMQRNDYPGFLDMKDSKISLLEKRLLGKKIEENKPSTSTSTVKNNKKKSSESHNIKKEEIDAESAINYSPNPQHNSSKRTVYVNSNDPSYCEICLKTWPAKKHLWQHYIRCHKSVAATVCGICLKTNNSYSALQAHLRQTHPTLLHGQGFGSNFICRICGRYHNASSKLRLHMAIHENFDWTLLEPPKEENKDENGYQESTNEINYESLIEQVECSSGCDSETETVVEAKDKGESSSDEDDDDDDDEEEEEEEDDEDESESEVSENSLEAQMLTNMMREKGVTDNGVKIEYGSTNSEDSSGSCFSAKGDGSSEEDESTSSNVVDGNGYRCKREELDSAIQSIKYECVEKVEDDVDEEYCEIPAQTLNDNEIESAVGSIL
ncbi:hypothetical protein Zmor_018408 [Zophobas morio]|uniref:Uncharacterized protein n=1 Tax=Zophobas morio TaxID=2755281 RepID=A0AA38MDU4_9CUCU|nr:hypothetical protein Zmor_018408 [Zophobas morio]